MKKHLLILITALAINYFTSQFSAPQSAADLQAFEVTQISSFNPAASNPSYGNGNFRCDERKYCSQMTSREEAEFFLLNCPNTKLDGDKDGLPCEKDSRW